MFLSTITSTIAVNLIIENGHWKPVGSLFIYNTLDHIMTVLHSSETSCGSLLFHVKSALFRDKLFLIGSHSNNILAVLFSPEEMTLYCPVPVNCGDTRFGILCFLKFPLILNHQNACNSHFNEGVELNHIPFDGC